MSRSERPEVRATTEAVSEVYLYGKTVIATLQFSRLLLAALASKGYELVPTHTVTVRRLQTICAFLAGAIVGIVLMVIPS